MSSSDDDQGWQWARTVILINELLARVALKHFRLRLLWKVKVILFFCHQRRKNTLKRVKDILRHKWRDAKTFFTESVRKRNGHGHVLGKCYLTVVEWSIMGINESITFGRFVIIRHSVHFVKSSKKI